jgi:hypothetical protein
MAYTFFRWFRSGIAAALTGQPTAAAAGQRRAKVAVGVDVGGVDGAGATLAASPVYVALDVLGPADVTGIDGRQVIRMYPLPGTTDFESGYYAHVELDRPDLPWLFTPFGPDTAKTLRPWICLVVVKRGDDAGVDPTLPPTLKVKGTEIAELPHLDEAHRWAHLQVTGDTSAGLQEITVNEPGRILGRLISPRSLEPDTAYSACVVPTYKIGALAGLGRDVPTDVKLDAPAWTKDDALVELPVYHYWEFATGIPGDFESLVLKLQPTMDLPGVGTRPLDVTSPGFGMSPRTPAATVPLGGVFAVDAAVEPPVDDTFAADVEPIVDTPDAVAPPIYGRWHAALAKKLDPASPSGWVEELNLDPRHRVAAGLGTQVVQDRQEDLMAAVWQQLGEILRANQLLRQAQLAVAASERVVARHLEPLPSAVLLALAGPALARIRVSTGRTARKAVVDSCLPLLALSGAFRRIVRVNGPLDRRLGPLRGRTFPDVRPDPAVEAESLVSVLAGGSLSVRPVQLPSGAVPLPETRIGSITSPAAGRPILRDPGRVGRLEELLRLPDRIKPGPLDELAPTFSKLSSRAAATGCTPLDVGALAGTIRAAIDPDVAVRGRARAQITIPQSDRIRLSSRLDPIMAAPVIPTPMIGPLLELGQEWLLPGIAAVPPNTIAIVEPNSAFIEAYMVGLNHEMGRELLWRGFPTDQRGTVFAQFWDRRGSVATPTAPLPDQDIPPIHTWRDQAGDLTELGANMDHGAADLVVLLIRGDLLQRYPRTNIYAQSARWKRDGRAAWETGTGGDVLFEDDRPLREPVPLLDDRDWESYVRFPVFRGQALGDITFLGIPKKKEEVHGLDSRSVTARTSDTQAGWYIVLEEQPTEPRFGGTPPANLRSDDLANALLKQAFRLFVHGRDLVPG